MCILHAEMARDIMTFADSTVPPSKVDLPKDLVNYGDELTRKPRKPYTITKQREKWTEEEHEKFLEALKLYGRAWRNIEEHVGTKTAIQIRSHAQKFFTKVVRESTGSSNPIEIPPPRPKRRPSHPYPRKLNLPAKSITPMQGGEGFDQEKESPTSVLSGSDSHTYDFVNCSISSDTSTTGPTASARCENSIEDKHSEAEQDDRTTLDDEQSMVQKNDATLTSFQLFGTLVIIASPKTRPSHCGASEAPASSPCQEIHPTAGKQATKQIAKNSNSPPAAADVHCSCGLLPFFYQEQGTEAPLTWLPFFGNPMKPFFANSHDTPPIAAEAEESGTASNSSTEELCGSKVPVQSPKAKGFLPYKRHQEERGVKTGARGFVPYWQCLMEREEMQQQQESDEGREHQRVKLS